MKKILTSIIALAAAFAAFGAEWYVDPVNGLDTRDGTTSNVVSETVGPRKTLEKAMELVNANDTLWFPRRVQRGVDEERPYAHIRLEEQRQGEVHRWRGEHLHRRRRRHGHVEHFLKELRPGRQCYRRHIRGRHVQGRLWAEA